ncbi:MAG: prolipoprotein diacylglyceryl transferase [Gammaproteobacteria bacterium]|nr:prolipoprotein diacylglyceryl transferase [Gammaproteobacteria bacterium]
MTYPDIDPVALSLGPVKIHWYGVLYLVAFASAWWLGRYRARQPNSGWQVEQVEDLIFYGALGVVLGGRIGYVLFYNFTAFLDNPLMLFTVWQGGMSFHGGLLGVMLAIGFYARKQQRGYFEVLDFVAPLVPLGLGAGRIGNFINAELWGKVSDLPWAMVFPGGGPEPRHPSMLYEFFLEGVVLFLIIWFYSGKPRPALAVSGLFGACYGLFRILVEFVRMPDAHIGYLAGGWLTKGMLLSLPMVVIGVGMMLYAYRKKA